MLRKTCRRVATLAGIFAAGSVASADSVNLPLHGKDTVAGTLRPASDRENFLCDVPQGAALAVSLKGKSPGGPVFQVLLEDGGGPVAGAAFVTKGSSVALSQPFAVAASGRYRVGVTGDSVHDGDYELKVAWKPRTAWSAAGGPLAPAAADSFTFGAAAGAGATIDVRPAARSAFAGTIVGVTGPDGPLVLPAGTTSHLVIARLPSTGDYTVQFQNAGASAGTWTAKAKLKPPRGVASRIDIRDGRLTGPFGGDHTVYGSVVGPTGGLVEVTATYGPLDGSSVSIPSGVLPGPTILTVSAAPPISSGAGNHPAGPAVEFGPPGTTFDPSGTDPSKQATITVPFDPAYFPSGTDSLVIFVRSSSGAVSAVPRPYTFGANTVSFATSHFSSYQAATADPRPLSGRFLALEMKSDALPAFAQKFGYGVHTVTSNANGTTLDQATGAVIWTDDGQLGSSASLQQKFNSIALNVTVNDDHSITTDDPTDPTSATKLRRGASDDVLVGNGAPIVLLRRTGGTATTATIAGRWHYFYQSIGTSVAATQPPGISIDLTGTGGVLTLASDGTVQIASVRGFDSNTAFPAGAWQSKSHTTLDAGATWDFLDDGTVAIRIPGQTFPITLTAVLDGDVLVGTGSTSGGPKPDQGPGIELFVLVRASSGAKLSQAAGDYFSIGAETDTVDAKTGAQDQTIDFHVTTLTSTITAAGAVTINGFSDLFTHDSLGASASALGNAVSGPGGRITVKPDGSFTSTDGSFGAFSRRGDFFVRAVSDGTKFSLDFGTPLVLSPR
jgi:hypothetical protein